MDRELRIGVRSLLLTGLVLLALVAAYLLGGSGGGGSPATAAERTAGPAPERRTLTMLGTGEATAVPDQLSFALSVGLRRDDLATALDDANGVTRRVLASLSAYGVKRRDVQTTGLSMSPVYEYHAYAPPTLTGYRVTEQATVLVRELERGGAAVTAAIGAGGNDVRVGGIRLLVGDTDAVLARARREAVEQATAKAEEYAGAAGAALGDVVTLQEVEVARPPTSYVPTAGLPRSMDDRAAAAVPIRAGRDSSRVTVRVVWQFA
jgi:uncharacterized protein